MSSNRPEWLSHPTRQSPAALLLILSRFVRLMLRQLWPFLLILLLNPKGRSAENFTLIILALGGVSALASMFSYFRFYFLVENGQFILQQGFFRRSVVSIPLDRIQSVTFQQNVLHRLFGVVGVDIDTAGSQGSEASILALSQAKAEELRDYLMQFRQEQAQESEATSSPQWLLSLQPADLLRIGLGQNHLRTAGILLALAIGFLDDVREALGMKSLPIEEWIQQGAGLEFLGWALSLGILLLLVAFLGTLILTVVRHYDFRVRETARGFYLSGGLFNRRELSAVKSKIQFMRWQTNPLLQRFHLYAVRLFQAASESVQARTSIQIPGAYPEQLEVLQESYFPGFSQEETTSYPVDKQYFIRRFLWLGLLPGVGLLLGTLVMQSFGTYTWLGIFWIPFSWFWHRHAWRNWSLALSPKGLQVQYGVWTRTGILLEWKHVQSVEINQSPFQQRAQLADITFYTAAGAVSIPYISLNLARPLRNYVLFTVETNQESWM